MRERNPDEFPDSVITHLAPIAHAHINMRGVISFALDRAAKGLIVPTKARLFRETTQKLIDEANQSDRPVAAR